MIIMVSGNSQTYLSIENGEGVYKKIFEPNRTYSYLHEYFTYKYLEKIPNVVPKIIKANKAKLTLYLEYFANKPSENKEYGEKYLFLIEEIHNYMKKRNIVFTLYAKEPLQNNLILCETIKERINLHALQSNSWDQEYKLAINSLTKIFSEIEPKLCELKIASPMVFNHADSGLHNTVADKEGNLRLIDLEYAGMDSPIKQHIDYLLHPKNVNYSTDSRLWSDYFKEDLIAKNDHCNLNIYNCSFALKWALITLNEFLDIHWERRVYAHPIRVHKRATILKDQLKKARIYLKTARQLLDSVEPRLLFTKDEKVLLSKSY
ncbi:Predicted hydrolase, HAD superfamily [Prochlorococcus marinus subsp. marinus str. CCMP1375]|uniref:Predicted hydrolase, HAD superfamily n=2 Tax=Prochlorococcaceae TaxID=2881426 RepID=Q7VB21_PROMA|nr:Predicted hydrolase, HAD superfamily [Prochlorococcus marinus subsp. marinus str. CCMP1375]